MINQDAIDAYTSANPLDRSASPLLLEHNEGDQLYTSGNNIELLVCHYGFVLPLVELPNAPENCQKWKQCLKSLGVVLTDPITSLFSLDKVMLHFTWSLMGAHPGINEWDLHDGNHNALVHTNLLDIYCPASHLFLLSSLPST